MILFTDNQADNASITDSEATVNYPPSNVKDSRLSRIYKSSKSPNLDINAGGGLKNISDAYTNLVQDPNDFTTSNWTELNGLTASASSESFRGVNLTKIVGDGVTSDPQIIQSMTATSSVNLSQSLVIRNHDHTTENIQVFAITTSPFTVLAATTIRFDNKTVTQTSGDALNYTWFDDDTVEIFVVTNTSAGTGLQYRVDPDENGVKACYVGFAQIIDNSDCFCPFISGSKSADTITESFTMPDRFTFDMVVTPFFQYDVSANVQFFTWDQGLPVSGLLFASGSDQFFYRWRDQGASTVFLGSQQFDDGTSFVPLNQRIRIVGSIDTKSGANTSRLIVIPLEDGALNEDATWTATPDIKETVYDTISIGHDSGVQQSNAEFEYLRFYEGLLVGTVSSSSDVDTLLEDKTILLDKTYQSKITATDLLIANSTIRDGDTITLQGNDVDSWGTGTPLYETVVWNKNIIRHNFTESSYQYWRLSVNSSNEIEIGRLYLGGRYQAPGVAPTVTQDYNSASVKSRSISGQSYQDTNYKYRIIGVRHPAMVFDDKEEFEKILDTVDIGTPFFVYFEESDDNCTDLQAYYVTIEGEGFRFTPLTNNQYHTLSYDLREEV